MQYIISYDLADDERRYRLAKALLDFGKRIEVSVFLADLDDDLAQPMIARVNKCIHPDADCVHVFVLCAACAAKTRTYGRAEISEDKEFYIV